MYFVSFVLTAQFVLINVVVAVLMKHLDDSNKEAQEEAEMDAEIELELAQGTLCCMGAPGCGSGGADKGLVVAGAGSGGSTAGKERGGGGRSARGDRGDGVRRMQQHPGQRSSNRTVYSPAQVSLCECVCGSDEKFVWCVCEFLCTDVSSKSTLLWFNLIRFMPKPFEKHEAPAVLLSFAPFQLRYRVVLTLAP